MPVYGAGTDTLQGDDAVPVYGAGTEPMDSEGAFGATAQTRVRRSETMRYSAEAVQVVDTERARRESADLGEVLGRRKGVVVRRTGGLGSDARLSLGGFADDQIRMFIDGVPLEFSGFGLGVASVPVNLVQRVEIYRGVVPIRFGADALGGALNLVSDEAQAGTSGSASFQRGSFGTYRLTAALRHLSDESGVVLGGAAFFDRARNDYPVDVEVADAEGRIETATVDRFHDGYGAQGANVELGVLDRPWAKRLLLRLFTTGYDKELQHNLIMSVPYGEVTFGERVDGATLRYGQDDALAKGLHFDALVGFSARRIDFEDLSPWVYDWFGTRIRARPTPGEVGGDANDQSFHEHHAIARLHVEYEPSSEHTLRLSLSPGAVTRSGRDRVLAERGRRDPSAAERSLFSFVPGVEYQLKSPALENIAFAKGYVYRASSTEVLPGGVDRRFAHDEQLFGAGDSARLFLSDHVWLKAAYELAARLPRADEIFGDGVQISPNPELRPERSHNVNLGLALQTAEGRLGKVSGELSAIGRFADDLIVLVGDDRAFGYANVYAARGLGGELSAGWTSPGELLAIGGNATFIDLRNTSSSGTFGSFTGDRIPNRPWLYANGETRLQLRGVGVPNDELALTLHTQYVHEFFRGWESAGVRAFKQVVPSQLQHSATLSYAVYGALVVVTTLELSNLTDARIYDYFGVQKPGRAFYFKGSIEF